MDLFDLDYVIVDTSEKFDLIIILVVVTVVVKVKGAICKMWPEFLFKTLKKSNIIIRVQ